MKNMLTDLRDNLFKQMDWLANRDITGDALREEVQRQLIFNEHAKLAITNGALIARCLDTLSGLDDIPEDLPLIPLAKKGGKPAVAGKRQALIDFPKKAAMG